MLKKILLLTLLTVTLFSCRVAFVPAKSAVILADLQDVSASSLSLYDRMLVSPDKSYATYAADYDYIGNKIDSISNADKTRNRSGMIVQQDARLQTIFNKYRQYHIDRSVLTNPEIRVFKEYLKSFIRPRLVSELSF